MQNLVHLVFKVSSLGGEQLIAAFLKEGDAIDFAESCEEENDDCENVEYITRHPVV